MRFLLFQGSDRRRLRSREILPSVLTPEEFLSHLDAAETPQISDVPETTVRGYRVNVKYKEIGSKEQGAKSQAISQVILQAMKRLRD
jgi:hypothetical protein